MTKVARPLRVAIVAANTFEHDSRLLRTARALAGDGHVVTVLAFQAPGLPTRESVGDRIDLRRLPVDRRVASAFRPLPERAWPLLARVLGFEPAATSLPPAAPRIVDRPRALLRRLVEIVAHQRRVGPWSDAVVAAVPDADVYHCKALVALPVVAAAAERAGSRFVYDLADLHTEAARLARMPGFVRSLVRRREARWVHRAALLTAVSDGVASEAARRFHVGRPVVVLNCPMAWRPEDPGVRRSDLLRRATGVDPERPIVLYQGGFSVDRGIEELIAALDREPLRTLDAAVVLLGYGRLLDRLRAEAARRPGRLFVLDAVPPAELLQWTASADLGYVGQPARTLNQRLNLANKLFESMMAGVPVLVAEGTEHCRLVSAEAVGVCAAIEPDAIARAAGAVLGRPFEEREALRDHCRTVALERYTWERQQGALVAAYRRLAAGGRAES
ncbi:MAG: glycosyltransferase [Chloroflexi bacterium]|nr:glycosyltransferase [Chloroflexota bacterium]